MEVITNFFSGIYDLGALVMMPIVMFFLALLFGMGVKKSLRVGLTVGVGLAGVYLILDFFIGTVSGVSGILAERYGGALTFVDIGWGSFSAIGWASTIGLIFIPIGLVTNLILILVKFTNNLNVNIWDYWEAIVGGMIVQALTGNFVIGLVVATVIHIINLKVGDMTQPYMENYFGFKGIVSYAPGYAEWGLIGRPISWIMDHIPGIRKVNLTPEYLTKKFGFFGEPMFIGSVIGIIMGLVAGVGLGQSFLLGVNLAAAMYIQPKMISILMEGLVPLSDGAKKFMDKRAPGRQLFIGLDPAIGTGNATALAVSVLMVPTAIVLALVLPGSKVMPLADLTFIVFFSMWAAALCNGDVLKSYLTTVVFTIFAIYSNAYTAPVMNNLAAASGLFSDTTTAVTHFANGYFPHSPIVTLLGQLLSGVTEIDGTPLNMGLGIILVGLIALGLVFYFIIGKNDKNKVAEEEAEK